MRFSIASAMVAFAASALAQTEGFNKINIPNNMEEVQAGSNFEVKWEAPAAYKDKTVSISLIGGPSQPKLQPLADIDSGISNSAGSYNWAVPEDLGAEAIYGLVMKLDSDPSVFQYSKPFQIVAGKGESNGEGQGYGGVPCQGECEGKPTKTMTSTTGVKTVTISSCPPESTMVTTTRPSNATISHPPPPPPSTTKVFRPTSVYVPPPPPSPPTTEVAPPVEPTPVQPPVVEPPVVEPPVVEPPVVEPPVEETPTPAPPAPPAPTSAGAHLVAGPMAIVGGFAVALLAF